jgi:importin-5
MSQPTKCFTFIVQALEADTLTGNIKDLVVNAAKTLVQSAGLSADHLLAGMAPETQEVVRKHFG